MGQRAAIYARVSTADQSCERQLRDLAGFAERGGYEVVEVFRETASGMKGAFAGGGGILRQARPDSRREILLVAAFYGRARKATAQFYPA
ncbi:MAG: recombinase family protein, partial [Pseudomonadota bacterium]